MNKHIQDADGTPMVDQATRRSFVQNWISQQQRRIAAGLGGSVLMLPLLAEAQTGGLVNVASIDGVFSVQVAADGSAQITMINGQVVNIAAAEVTVAAGGNVFVTAAAAQVVTEVAAIGVGLGGGLAAGGLGAGAAVAGAGVAAAVAAGGGGGGGGGGAAPALPVLNAAGLAGANPVTTTSIFGSFPTLQPGDRVFIRIGTGPEFQVSVAPNGAITFPPALDLSTLQGAQTIAFRQVRDVPRLDANGAPVLDGNGNPVTQPRDISTGSSQLRIDTVAPSVTINPIAVDNVINAAERGAGVTVSGTAPGVEDGQVVTLNFAGTTVTATVTGGTWSVTIGTSVLQGLANGAALNVTATVSDSAGNPASPATLAFSTDFTAALTVNPVAITTLNTFTGLVVSGTTTGVEAGRTVAGTLNTTNFTAVTAADGTWTATIPAATVTALGTGTNVTIRATVSDVAGNTASGTRSATTDFSQPALAISSPATGGFLNATTAAQTLVVSGQALEGTLVTVTLSNGQSLTATASPSNAWQVSFAPAALPGNGPLTINASATIGGTPVSAPAVSLTIDTVVPAAPTLALVADTGVSATDGITSNANVTVTGLETGSVREFSTNGGTTWTAFTGSSFLVPGGDGARTVIVRQTDAAGNISPSSPPLVFTVDTTAPAAPTLALVADTGASATDGITSNANVSVSNLAVGTIREFSTNGGTSWTAFTGSSFAVPGGDGARSVIVRQIDVAGNISPSSAPLAFTLDTSSPAAPTLALVADTGASATDGITSNANVTVTGLEAGSVREFSTNGGTSWTTFTGSSFLVPGGDGARSVIVRQTDAAGNTSPSSAPLVFTVDTGAPARPVLSLVADTGASATDGITSNANVSVTGLEAGSVREFSTNGGTSWTTFTGSSFLVPGGDGARSVIVRQTDAAGNTSPSSAPLAFTVDTGAAATPTIALAVDSGLSISDRITSNPNILVSGLEAGSVREFSTNGGTSWTTFTGTSFAVTGGDGARTVIVRQTDAAGNISGSSAPLSFTLDTTAPATPTLALVADTGASATDRITSNPNVSVTGLEAGTTREFSTNGGTSWTEFTGTSFAVTGGDGARTVIVRQTDAAGNVSASSAPLSFTLDATAPARPALALVADTGASATDGITSNPNITVTGLEAGSVREFSTNGGTSWTTFTGNSFAVTGGDGARSVIVRQTDAAGNISASSAPLAFTLDTTAPLVTISSFGGVANNGTLTTAALSAGGAPVASLALSGATTAPDGTSVTVSFGTTTLTTTASGGSWTLNVPRATIIEQLAGGTSTTITASVTDLAGNSGSGPLSLNLNLPPAIAINALGPDNALVLANVGSTIPVSGTTSLILSGRPVEIRNGANVVGTATVQADGSWSTTITTPSGFAAGNVLNLTASVANSATGAAVTASQSAVGYQAAELILQGGTAVTSGAASGAVEFAFILDPRKVLPADNGLSVQETLSFNPAVATYAPNPPPQFAAGLTGVTNTANAATGQVVFAGAGLLSAVDPNTGDPINLFRTPIIRVRLNHTNTAADIVLNVDSQIAGDYVYVYGSDQATTMIAPARDGAFRGRGGDDTINITAAGKHSVIFETTGAANGEDLILGFDLGTPLGDRIGFHALDNATLRGDGSRFEVVTAGTAISANTGFVVISTSLNSEAQALTAIGQLGLGANDVVYLLIGSASDSELMRIVVDGTGALPAPGNIEVLGTFSGLGAAERALFSSGNILGFEAHNV